MVREHARDSPKVNVWCRLLWDQVISPFSFVDNTVNTQVYQDMLEQFAFPQLEDRQPRIIWQQDGAPPNWALTVCAALDVTFPGRWIGRDGPILWPRRSPDITPLDFFLWGYVKEHVYKTPVPDMATLKERIKNAIATVKGDLTRFCKVPFKHYNPLK